MFFMAVQDVAAAAPSNIRFGGMNRYETSVNISQNSFEKSEYVVLVSGENFPDAISAAPLAKKYNAPILITEGNNLNGNVNEEIKRLGTKNIFIVGGLDVVSKTIEEQLTALNIQVTRISGQDRYETSAKVAESIGTGNGVVLASGENFPDALSIASIAAAKQMPILLTQSKILPDSVKEYINSNSISKSYVVGGIDVINDNVVKDLPNMKRLSGIDRYETNLNVINEFLGDFNFNNLYLAYGGDFPDALCGSAAAAKDFAPIVLVSKSYTRAQSLIRSKIDSISSLKILGGTFAISDALVQSILYPSKTVLGYTTYYYIGDSSSYNSIINHSQAIDSIATDTYIMDSIGNIKGSVPYNQVSYANDNKIKTYAMVSNSFNADTAKGVLENSTNRQKLINNILQSLKANNYKGVNIDIENVYYYDRSYFTTFMRELYNTLNPQGFEVTIALPAKTSDSMWQSWIGAYDYAEIAKVSDKIVLMTYDEHWSGGEPGAIASIGWVQNVINYAITVIPRDKILLGLAAYAYDWTSNGAKAKSYGISQAYNMASQKGAQVKWDSAAKSPYFNYTDSSGIYHTVYFENSTSISYKLDIVNNYDLGGVSIWRLGLENSDYWEIISNKFNRY